MRLIVCIRHPHNMDSRVSRRAYRLFEQALGLLIIRGHFIVDIADQRYSHLGGVVSSENITNKMCLNLHMHL